MKTVKYQKDKLDQLTHTYIYDRANRLEEVFVSTDKIHQSRQAHYLYYDYGPLARVELGEQKVQGMDYAYTINGWMKAMNGTVLNPGYELGRDNASGYLSQNTSVHSKFARDVVGYTLGYFNGDYKSIGSTNFAPSPYTGALSTAISQLYNGNIAYTTTAIADVPGSGIQMGIQMGVYRYDQMNRLVGARTFRASGLAASNSWAGVAETQEYASTYRYDANGNLTKLQRNGGVSNLNMDQFEYQFEPVANTDPTTGTHASNRLDYVKDELSYSANYSEDIDNQNQDNYGYDKLGQLIRDNSEGLMTIEWFSGNRKVKKITRSGKTIEFKYNPFGQRLLKTVTNTSTGVVTTSYYAYDANGQVMGVYEVNLTTNKVTLNELNIYGASRLGMIDRDIDLVLSGVEQPAPVYPPVNPVIHTLGYKKYEITNYLGNVNAVITDRKLVAGGTYEAVVIMNSDYYPFGMAMPERHTNEQNYRFGYNGMELDNEAKGNGNSYTTEFRQYDPRLGRWLSLDPLMMKFPWMSPYVGMDNNPVLLNDPMGLSTQADYYDAKTKKKLGSDGINDGRVFYINKVDWQDARYLLGKTKGDPLQAALIQRGAREVHDVKEKYELGNQDAIRAGYAEAQRHYENNRSKARVPEPSRKSSTVKVAPGQPSISNEDGTSTLKGERLEYYEAQEEAKKQMGLMPGFDQFQKIGNGLEVGAPIALMAVGQEYAFAWLKNSIATWKATNAVSVAIRIEESTTTATEGILVRHHTNSEGLAGIKSSGNIVASRTQPYGVDIEVAPFVRATQANMGQAGKGAYVEFTVPQSLISPCPSYMGGIGNAGRIVTEGVPLNIQNFSPRFVRFNWLRQ